MKNFTAILMVVTVFASGFVSGCAHEGVVNEPSDAEINAEAAKAYNQVKAKSRVRQIMSGTPWFRE